MDKISLKSINTRLDSEFLLIFVKMKKISEKLDLILNKIDPNPEDLLSQSEIDMMKSWRADAEAMESVNISELPHPADEEPAMFTEYRTNEADNTPTGQ